MYNPVKTIKTNTVGTVNMLGLAKRVDARILIASTSEVYGDPEVEIGLSCGILLMIKIIDNLFSLI